MPVRSNASGDVIVAAEPPRTSIGFLAPEFFATLGDTRWKVGGKEQQAEQLYLLANMEKGGLWAASRIALHRKVGIAVRGTGLLAHMGIESGDPTKAVEFKNKTSKVEDLYLCDWLHFEDLGAVVHYDPRVGWTPEQGVRDAGAVTPAPSAHTSLTGGHVANPALRPFAPGDWVPKRAHIESVRAPQLRGLVERGAIPPFESLERKIKDLFESRVKEYIDNDPLYRPGGCYAAVTRLHGVQIRLEACPDRMMVGDHDLFGFTDPATDRLLPLGADGVGAAQADLQASRGFQAQHAGIFNWDAPAHQLHIKDKIMGAHGPDKNEPLVYFKPVGDRCVVMAAFYVKGAAARIASVWNFLGPFAKLEVRNPLSPL